MALNDDFADALRRLRYRLGTEAEPMSQQALSTQTGIALNNIHNWEQGRSLPRVPHLVALLTASPKSADDIFGVFGMPRPARRRMATALLGVARGVEW